MKGIASALLFTLTTGCTHSGQHLGPTPKSAQSSAAAPEAPVNHQPWWAEVEPGVRLLDGQPAVVAVGRSVEHHHVAEGWLSARVAARIAVRRAAESIAFSGPMPEPVLLDFFIDSDGRFLAWMAMVLPPSLAPPHSPPMLAAPPEFRRAGRRRVGQHFYEGERHLFLECEVEGPIANPDWGRPRVSAEREAGPKSPREPLGSKPVTQRRSKFAL